MPISIQLFPSEPRARTKFLTEAFSPDRFLLLRKVIDEAALLGFPIYIVGGFVRDLLLGLAATDLDLVVEGDAVILVKNLTLIYGGDAIIHQRFKTARWVISDSRIKSNRIALDLISSRAESYKKPAALPTVRPGKLIHDLKRRDFTINALAIRLDGKHFGELHDDLGGMDDLIHGRVRTLHPNSFKDDPTRMFRAVRYAERFRFTISPETHAQIPSALCFITNLSAERLRHELDLVMEEESVDRILLKLSRLKILSSVHPLLKWDSNIAGRMKAVPYVPIEERRVFAWVFWLMHFSCPEIEEINSRLHFPANQRDAILGASRLWADREVLMGKRSSECVDILDGFPITSIRAVYLSTMQGELRHILHKYLDSWRQIKPKTNGYSLKKLGLEPGPKYASILHRLREAWIEGEVTSEAEEKKLLEGLILNHHQ